MSGEEHRTAHRIVMREVPAERAQEARADRVLGRPVHADLVVEPAVDAVGQPDDIDEADAEGVVEGTKITPGIVRCNDRRVEGIGIRAEDEGTDSHRGSVMRASDVHFAIEEGANPRFRLRLLVKNLPHCGLDVYCRHVGLTYGGNRRLHRLV